MIIQAILAMSFSILQHCCCTLVSYPTLSASRHLIEMTELEANRVGKRFLCEVTPFRRQTQRTSYSNKRSKTPWMTAVITAVLTGLVPDPVRLHHSICHRPGVFDSMLEELLFCVCLLRVAHLRKKRLRKQFASSTGIFKYNNDIHATSNDVTNWSVFGCSLFQTLGGGE